MEPDLVGLAVTYLNANLAEPVSGKVPNPRPASWVRVSSAGGAGVADAVLSDWLLAVECWGVGTPAAINLALRASQLLREWEGQVAGDTFIYSCSPATPRDFPDPLSGSDRYLFTAAVTARTV